MPGDDGLTKMVLAIFVVLFIIFAGFGFYFMTQIGSVDKPDTLVQQLESERMKVKDEKTKIVELTDAVAKEQELIKEAQFQIEVEEEQSGRLRLTRANFQTHRDTNRGWVSGLEKTRSQVAEYLEGGASGEPYGFRSLTVRKDDQERANAQSISRLDSAIDEARNELTKANNRYTRRYETKRSRRSKLETELDQTKDELQKASQREPVDTMIDTDGRVLATDLATRQIVINVGENQGVKRGMRFEVFRVRQGGRRAHKGFIDVRVTEKETSVCTILTRDVNLGRCPSCGYTASTPEEAFCPYCTGSGQGLHVQRLSAPPRMTEITMTPNDPVVVGDLVQNPFFAPNDSLRFAVKGDPLSVQVKNEEILDAIRWHGGAIDAEIGAGTDVLLAGKWATEETRRAKDLGIQILHHYHLFDFLRK
jgi:hypothetical protein